MVRVWTTLVVFAVALAIGSNVALAKKEKKEGEKKRAKVEDVFKKLDKDSDGKLSKDEFAARGKDPEKAKAAFVKVDTNSDGSISLEEFKTFAKKLEERAKKKKEKDGDKKPPK